VLKIVLLLGEQSVLKELLLQDHQEALTTVFMAFLRSEDTSVEDALMKFWLVRRICKDYDIRNIMLRAEGCIMMLMSVMRSVNLDVGEELSILSPFCYEPFSQDISLTTSELISHFVDLFQHGESTEKRRKASDLLLIFAGGLCSASASSDVISSSFIDSGSLLNVLKLLHDENHSSEAEWRERSAILLYYVVEDARIREVFLGEPLFVLHNMLNSFNNYEHKFNLFVSLIPILQVIVLDPCSHARLFDVDIVLDLADYIRQTLTTSSIAVSEDRKTLHVLECLQIFEIFASSEESCAGFMLSLEGMVSSHLLQTCLDIKNHFPRKLERSSRSALVS
jgi:hypothetical protein